MMISKLMRSVLNRAKTVKEKRQAPNNPKPSSAMKESVRSDLYNRALSLISKRGQSGATPLREPDDRTILIENQPEQKISFEEFKKNVSEYCAEFQTLNEAVDFWQNQDEGTNGAKLNLDDWRLNSEESSKLKLFLGRLRDTADFKNKKNHPYLTRRVISFLEHLEQEEIRNLLLMNIDPDPTGTCADGAMVMMDDIEITIRVHQAKDNRRELLNLGGSLMKLQALRQCAAEKVKSLVVVDETEVYLAYQTHLRERLELPVSTHDMLFERLSQVAPEDIENAYQIIIKQVEDLNAIEAYMATFLPLQQLLRREEIAEMPYEKIHRYVDISDEQWDDGFCIFTQQKARELKQPVWIQFKGSRDVVHWNVYEYESLHKRWIEYGTEALNRPVTITEWFRSYYETSSVLEKLRQVEYRIASCESARTPDNALLSEAARLACLNENYLAAIQYANQVPVDDSNYVKALEVKALAEFHMEDMLDIIYMGDIDDMEGLENTENNEELEKTIDQLKEKNQCNYYAKILSLSYKKNSFIESQNKKELMDLALSEQCDYLLKIIAVAAAMAIPPKVLKDDDCEKIEKIIDESQSLSEKYNEHKDNKLFDMYKDVLLSYIGKQDMPEHYFEIRENTVDYWPKGIKVQAWWTPKPVAPDAAEKASAL